MFWLLWMIFRDTSFWVFFREKSQVIEHLKSLFNKIQMEIGHRIVRIKNNRDKEFDNMNVVLFCKSKGIKHEFSILRTLQQNGMAKKKNKVL